MGRALTPLVLPSVLRAIAHGAPMPSDLRIDDVDVDWLLASGLGPILQWVTRDVEVLSASGRSRLHGAELASRITTSELFAFAERTVGNLQETGIECTVLKGISYASRYYPRPHLRMMGDVDLLMGADDLGRAESVLLANGFELPDYAPPETWHRHHHGPPLKHSESGMIVELHSRVLPPSSAAAAESILSIETIEERRSRHVVGQERVWVLDPEIEVLLIAAGWCSDLAGMFGRFGHQRPLFDMIYLVDSQGASLDWDLIVRLARGTFTGACLGVLLSYLERHGALNGPGDIAPRLLGAQRWVSRRSCKAIHALLDRHLIIRRRSRGLFSPHNVGAILGAFLTRRPSWRSWLAVPGALVFPPGAARRFEVGYQLRRLGSLFKASQ